MKASGTHVLQLCQKVCAVLLSPDHGRHCEYAILIYDGDQTGHWLDGDFKQVGCLGDVNLKGINYKILQVTELITNQKEDK